MGFRDIKNALKKIDQSFKGNDERDAPPIPPRGQDEAPPPIPPRLPKQLKDIATAPSSKSSGLFGPGLAHGKNVPSIFQQVQHAQKPVGCSFESSDAPIQTNNFYNNLCLEDQTYPVWTLPYSLWITKDPDQDPGLAFNHTEASQRVFGPDPSGNPAQFYFNPPKIKSFTLSAQGFHGDSLIANLESHNKLSVVAKLSSGGDTGRNITVPLVHGMGFISAVYNQLVPIIGSQVGVQQFERVSENKYRVMLFNQVVWTIYVTNNQGGNFSLELKDPNHIVANTEANNVVIQICRGESSSYDQAAGAYPISCHLDGSVQGNSGSYSFNYELQGKSSSGSTVVWCLPHHYEILDPSISSKDTGMMLDSPTKGQMKSYLTNELKMNEPNLPTEINFDPWSSIESFKGVNYSQNALSLIRKAAEAEVKQDVVGMANIDSMYTSGKILDKFAYILYVCRFVLKDDSLYQELLPKVKEAINIFAHNKQKYPLVYDTVWKGLISSAEPGADFGNSNYNDHHFHYGYHIHAIALVAKCEPSFVEDSAISEYTTTLLRDVATSSDSDPYFPQSRSFDWFHGHSFAHGIFASGDGKDEESSSEDYHFAYGMKLYAQCINDSSMENRANLMLAVMRRSMNMHMLFSDDNKIQPPQFIKNKVAGISFENKIDFATYFGRGTIADEWIHGIHMLPITPISSYIRTPKFVQEEWQQKLEGIIDQIPDGWKGILILNVALFNPEYAWKWFSRDDWNDAQIDNGMSRTWSLAYISAVGGF
ncbi:glucan endo-1,3-beta-D-glucosidase 2 [[Candida] anglica]